MLVKHNLALKTEVEWLKTLWSSSGEFENDIENNVIKFRNEKGNARNAYGIDYNIKEQTNYLYIELENIGDYPIPVSFTNLQNTGGKILYPKEKLIVADAFTTTTTNSTMRLNVQDKNNLTKWHKLRINKFMLCESKTDLYLYSKNALPQDKQSLYPPEGNYTEIYAL